jgi:two-component system sensor histidine kinase DesK
MPPPLPGKSIANKKMDNKGATLLWLAYTGFLFIDPIFDPSLRLWIATLVVVAAFVVVFFVYSMTCNRRLQYWMVGITFLLGAVSLPWNSGAISLFIYAAGFLPFLRDDLPIVLSFFFLEVATMLAETYLFHALGWHVSPVSGWMGSFLTLVIGGSNFFWARQKRADSKLRMAHEEIEALAAVAERERIARDLHDVLGHTLSVIVLKAELAGRVLERDPQRATSEINDVERIARTALADVREAIGGYRARGLGAEIEAARKTLDAAGVTLISEGATSVIGGLSAAEETALALALREAVTNIVRHARATTCQLRFVRDGDHRRLIVEDDGRNARIREGNGLRGMRERIESLGGRLSLESNDGTRLLIDLPLHLEGVGP